MKMNDGKRFFVTEKQLGTLTVRSSQKRSAYRRILIFLVKF